LDALFSDDSRKEGEKEEKDNTEISTYFEMVAFIYIL